MSIQTSVQKSNITINSRKYDGNIHRSWKAELLEIKDSLLIFVGEFEKEITHEHLGVIRRGTVSYEFYWLDRGYNVFRFHEPEGDLRNYYCNLNLPPTFENNVLNYVDLDVDVLVWADFSHCILDLDEFRDNAEIFDYPPKLRQNVARDLSKLIRLIENRSFPFDLEQF
jgi:protein associated with RNAse G/E